MLHAEIFAIASRVLADQVQFTYAHPEHPGRFVDNAFEAAASELAAILGNYAERAGMVTTLSNLDVSGMLGCCENTGGEVVIQIRSGFVFDWSQSLAKRGDFVQFVRPEHSIHFGHVLLDI